MTWQQDIVNNGALLEAEVQLASNSREYPQLRHNNLSARGKISAIECDLSPISAPNSEFQPLIWVNFYIFRLTYTGVFKLA